VNALRRKPVFLTEMETDLVNHCLQVEQRSAVLSCSSIRQITFQLAKENGIPTPPPSHSVEYERAGKKQLWGFFGQNSSLSFGTSKCVSAARLEALNAEK
jgi:hypothetical protein